MVLLTFALVAAMFRRHVVLRGAIGLLAATAIFFVIRAGHLGATLAWVIDKVNEIVDHVNDGQPDRHPAVREFSRFYTSRLGLARRPVQTQHPLAKPRVLLRELGANGITEMGDLRDALQIDRGQ